MNIHALELTKLPNVSIQLTGRLAKTLLRDKPSGEDSTEQIDQSAADLEEQLEVVADGLIVRMIATSPAALASELAFDRAVDAMWFALHGYLGMTQVYAHPGLDYLPAEVAKEIELDEARARAAEAAELLELTFGPLTVNEMVKTSMIEQVESTQLVLRNIDKQDLRPRLAAIVGPRLLDTIEACQDQYEAMVDVRLRRERGESVNLRTLRRDLRWALVEYVSAVVAKYRRKQPETATWVLARLQPILTLRQILARSPSEASTEEALDDFADFELDVDEGGEGESNAGELGDEG
jgi:hypothetical protein